MPNRRSQWQAFASCAVACLATGCANIAPAPAQQDPDAAYYEAVLLHRKLVVHPARIDVKNRYPSVVEVYEPATHREDQLGDGNCSGSLIAPHVVLTAAHCVCPRREIRKEDLEIPPVRASTAPADGLTRTAYIRGRHIDTIVEPSTCPNEATVKTILRVPPSSGGRAATTAEEHGGTVHVPPETQILFEGNNAWWSSADLAVIVLDDPVVSKRFPVYRLADSEPKAGDRVTLVGLGGDPGGLPFGTRRVGDNIIAWLRILETGGIELVAGEQVLPDGSAVTNVDGGDSGGACLNADDKRVLVGVIASRAEAPDGKVFSVITSVVPHLLWLRRQIKRRVASSPVERSTSIRAH